MGTSTTDDSDGAATRLHHLQQYFREHPVTGPVEGHRSAVTPGVPLQLGTLDHIQASVHEIAQHTYALNPAAGPVPAESAAVYDWAHQATEHADDTDRQRLEVVEYRQYLEHCIRAGEHKVIRRHPCPKCGTWGLMWQTERRRALCTMTECVDRDGISTTVSLGWLAFAHVMGQENLHRASAT